MAESLGGNIEEKKDALGGHEETAGDSGKSQRLRDIRGENVQAPQPQDADRWLEFCGFGSQAKAEKNMMVGGRSIFELGLGKAGLALRCTFV